MEATRVARLLPGCPACGQALETATCTMGTVVRCRGCQAPVSLVLKPSGRDLTFEVFRTEPPPTTLPEGLAQRFEVLSVLGAGGQGEVLRVRPRGATRDFALKWTRAATAGERGPREANYGAMPVHPNVLAPLQAGWYGELQYMVFDLVEGETLQSLLDRESRLTPPRALQLAHQAARALAHVHANSVIHRDVKPANLLLAKDGTLRLTDFGVATSIGTPPGTLIIGTPPYMAPEQVSLASQTPALDVYALGCVLYQMLTGATPYERDSMVDVMCARLDQDAPRVRATAPDCPEALDAFVARLLERDPKDRPADGTAALAELAACQRACGFDEHVALTAVPRETARDTALERARARRRVRVPTALLAGSAGLVIVACAAPVPFAVGYALLAAAFAFLFLGGRGLSAEWLGHPDVWWRSYLDPESYDALSLPGLLVGAFALFALGMFILAGVGVHANYVVTVIVYVLAVLMTGRVLLPAALEHASPPQVSDAPAELRIFLPNDGWLYRVLPAGQELVLAHRLELAEGLNRLEVWRGTGRRRVFLVWATPGMQLAMRLADDKDGPRVVTEGRRALPPGRA